MWRDFIKESGSEEEREESRGGEKVKLLLETETVKQRKQKREGK